MHFSLYFSTNALERQFWNVCVSVSYFFKSNDVGYHAKVMQRIDICIKIAQYNATSLSDFYFDDAAATAVVVVTIDIAAGVVVVVVIFDKNNSSRFAFVFIHGDIIAV